MAAQTQTVFTKLADVPISWMLHDDIPNPVYYEPNCVIFPSQNLNDKNGGIYIYDFVSNEMKYSLKKCRL